MKILSTTWKLVIDTEQYAGNFERQMCAYCTGQIGDCGVGSEFADMFNEEVAGCPFYDAVISKPDDHGCNRPCYIEPTPGWKNNGNGVWRKTQNTGSPAYLSVAIFFDKRPTQGQIDIIKDRALKFSAARKGYRSYHEDITVTGFRIVSEVTREEVNETV